MRKQKIEDKKVIKEIIPENLPILKTQPSTGQVSSTTDDIYREISGFWEPREA